MNSVLCAPTEHRGVEEQRRHDAAGGLCNGLRQPVRHFPGHAQGEPATGTATFKAVESNPFVYLGWNLEVITSKNPYSVVVVALDWVGLT